MIYSMRNLHIMLKYASAVNCELYNVRDIVIKNKVGRLQLASITGCKTSLSKYSNYCNVSLGSCDIEKNRYIYIKKNIDNIDYIKLCK
jgi:hypothetical protein